MRERLQSMVRVSAMLVSMAVLMGVASVASLTSLAGLTSQFSFVGTAHANDIQVTNTLVAEDSEAGVRVVSFDLSWENSWRVDNLFPEDSHNAINWDAGWVFLKYRTVGGAWKHATLMEDGFDAGVAVGENMGSGALMQVGLVDPGMAWDASENPGVGLMVYRGEAGAGRFAIEGAQLRWNYAVDGVSPEDDVAIALFAIEMVYVAPGAFYVGSGGAEDARFVAGGAEGSGNSVNAPFLVTGNWDGCVSDTEGCLWAAGSIDDGGTLASDFPTGFSGFYGMKYEVSQQQYVDFLNTLPAAQAQAWAYVGGEARNGISYVEPADGVAGYYTTSTPYVANNYMSWVDGAAYLDWAGLRPMTELEFEKAARGYADPVENEYAWGSTDISSTGGAANYSDLGEATESVSQGNAVYNGSNPGGPARVGIFAGEATTREQSGAGYWGIMELSGNVWERCVTVGNEEGRGFTGLHGDGELTITGAGNVPSWPGIIDSEIVGEDGSGFRGAGYLPDAVNWLALSFRRYATDVNPGRFYDFGIRGARTMPAESIVALTVQVSGAGTPNVGGTVSPLTGSYATGTQVELTATPADGWFFSSWTGDVPTDLPGGETLTDSVLTFTMDSDKSLKAIFEYNSRDTGTSISDIINHITGKIWMDRNLGASKVAGSEIDAFSYGDLYQWGRSADGHEKRNSDVSEILSYTDLTGHGDFIITNSSPYDWLNPQNDNLWQGVDGINNPCPLGYRLPTEAEWNAELESWYGSNINQAFAQLKITASGRRDAEDGSLNEILYGSYFWSSTVSGTNVRALNINSNSSFFFNASRANGYAVRCIKDVESLVIEIEGNGTVEPQGGSFLPGTQIELFATPAEDWVFTNWIGEVPEGFSNSDNPLPIVMDSYKTFTAVFSYNAKDTETEVVDVINPETGITWMDRNLGAIEVATSSTDSGAFGDLYQWGRATDGHQKRGSAITGNLEDTNIVESGEFITPISSPYDWRMPQNDNLWQQAEDLNNPCPSGYRLPTQVEWITEYESWISNDKDGAYGSPLKLTVGGNRSYNGNIGSDGYNGYYWSSSVSGTNAIRLFISHSNAGFGTSFRAMGNSVRCRRDGFSLKIGIEGNGMVDPIGGTYDAGSLVEVTATSASGWLFSGWTGNLPEGAIVTDSALTVIMNSDIALIAVFEEETIDNWHRDTATEVLDVVNPLTGRAWMDRNLGSSRAAISSMDSEAYGDLYQWGREADGHEKPYSVTISTPSETDTPGHGNFILRSDSRRDWRSSQNNNLWQGVVGINNPCPIGYRLPTEFEWEAELQSWNSNGSSGAYNSQLKLPVAGGRDDDGIIIDYSYSGMYWSSSVSNERSKYLYFNSDNAEMEAFPRALGLSVRCLKN